MAAVAKSDSVQPSPPVLFLSCNCCHMKLDNVHDLCCCASTEKGQVYTLAWTILVDIAVLTTG